jgi:hypothetical protein
MRNYSSQVQTRRVYSWFTGHTIEDQAFDRAIKLFLRCFETIEVSLMTPSEQSVIDDFKDWVTQANKDDAFRIVNGAFVYANLNTGEILVFIAWAGYEDYAVCFDLAS